VYESLRMRPPLIGYFPKVVPPGGDNILGYQLPGGTAIGTNMSAVLSSTDLFGPDADIFRPERFIELEDTRRKQMERDVELAFGHGQWMCVGKTIAFMEMYKSVFEVRAQSLFFFACPSLAEEKWPSTNHVLFDADSKVLHRSSAISTCNCCSHTLQAIS
jgi:cytochrome P450